ncbi:hypothetical protein EMIT093MI4_30106 [Pseudomonas sp. IT-93MI4]
MAQRPVLHSDSSCLSRNAGSIAEGGVSFIRRFLTLGPARLGSREGSGVGLSDNPGLACQ